MKRLLATTAVALCLTGPVLAETQSPKFVEAQSTIGLYASDVIGETVYTTEADVSGDLTVNSDALGDWDAIGEVEDILIDTDGNIQSAIVGVGGFLGLGEKDVAIDMTSFKYVRDADDENRYYLVLNSTADQLTNAPEFEREYMEDHSSLDADKTMESDTAAVETDTTTMEGDTAALEPDSPTMESDAVTTDTANTDALNRPMMVPPVVERDGYKVTAVEDVRSESLQGASVFGVDDERIGEIGDLIIADDGKISQAIIDVGGFLGMGEKEVAVGFEELTVLQSDDGDIVRVYVDTTEESLEDMPEYSRL